MWNWLNSYRQDSNAWPLHRKASVLPLCCNSCSACRWVKSYIFCVDELPKDWIWILALGQTLHTLYFKNRIIWDISSFSYFLIGTKSKPLIKFCRLTAMMASWWVPSRENRNRWWEWKKWIFWWLPNIWTIILRKEVSRENGQL